MSFSTRHRRRDLLKLAALFSTNSLFTPWSGLHAQAKDDVLRIGYLPITDATPLLVAHALGFYEAEGLEVAPPVMLRSWAQLLEAFLAGQVNVVHLLSPMTIWARYGSRAPLKVVAWNHMSGSALTVAPTIQSITELGGKTVAIPFTYSIHNVVLQHLLRQHHLEVVLSGRAPLTNNQVRLVVMAPSDMIPALAAKQIAGFIVAEPFNAQAELLGVGKILRFTGDVWKNHACCVVAMQEQDLHQRPEWSQKVVNALVKAQHWILTHREETARLLATTAKHRYTPHTETTLRKVLAPQSQEQQQYEQQGIIQHPAWQDQRIAFQPYPYPSYTVTLVEQLQQMRVDTQNTFLKQLNGPQVATDLVDDRFVKQAINDLGGLRAFGLDDAWERTEWIA